MKFNIEKEKYKNLSEKEKDEFATELQNITIEIIDLFDKKQIPIFFVYIILKNIITLLEEDYPELKEEFENEFKIDLLLSYNQFKRTK